MLLVLGNILSVASSYLAKPWKFARAPMLT